MTTRRLALLTWATIAMVVVDAATRPALLVAYQLSPDLYRIHNLSELAPATTDTAILLWTLLTMLVFGGWIVAAGRNLIALGHHDLAFTPWARLWWFLVPFANLIIPYHCIRELWNASHCKADLGETPPFVALWWAIWLLSFFDLTILSVFAGPLELMTIMWMQSVTGIVLAAFAIALLLSVSRAQAAQRGPGLAQVFA